MANAYTAVAEEPNLAAVPALAPPPIQIGATIRNLRLERGMSQGDIEKRTKLLRCYLSRVENGHTVPSLDTLQKIATALEMPLSQLFSEGPIPEAEGTALSEDVIHFLTQVQRYSVHLTDGDRRLLLALVRKFAATAGA